MINNNKIPVVAIVGRPNVGKSSLFNRILGRRHAVVEEREGTTRDRVEKFIKLKNKNFTLIDTGGYIPKEVDKMSVLIKNQIENAIKVSDILLFVCEGENGIMPIDREVAYLARRSGKRIILVVNKMDNDKRKESINEFYELGLGEPFPTSCLHNRGINPIIDEIEKILPEHSIELPGEKNPIKIAIVGRPNVGKSSFLNKVIEEERVIVHDEPGTTRDSVDSYFEKDGILFTLIDTAGIRHKRKVKNAVDVYSMMRARESIDESDVALLLIDGFEGVTVDDTKIFDYIVERGKGCAVLVNKWDLVKNIERARYENAISKKMPEARNFPVAFMSAKNGKDVLKAFNLVKVIKTNMDLSIDTATLRNFLKEINPESVRVSRKKRIPKFFYMVLSHTSPKEFTIFVNDPSRVTGTHISFIENRLREQFPLEGVPVKFVCKRLAKPRSK
jgi:GTPase